MAGMGGSALLHSCPNHSSDYVESICPSGLNSPITNVSADHETN